MNEVQVKPIYFYLSLAGIFGAIGPIASDLYIPSLPSIAHYFLTSTHLAQFSITTFVLGFACARFLMGTASDYFGRKIPLLFSLILCLLGTLYCLHASAMHDFLVGRCLQGFGAGGCNVVARIIFRDTIPDKLLPKYTSFYSMTGITLMTGAPLLGGYLQHYSQWQTSFIFIALFAVIAFLIALFFIGESHPKHKRISFRVGNIFKNFLSLLNINFLKYSVYVAFAYGVLMAWLTSGAVVLQNVVFLSAVQFGWCAALVGFGYFTGAFINSRVVSRMGTSKMILLGVWIIAIAGIGMVIPILFFQIINTFWIVMPATLAAFGASLLMPNSYATALMPYANIAGMAVALLGLIQMLGGAVTSAIISAAPDNNQLPLALIILSVGILLAFFIVLTAKIKVK